MTTRLTYEDAVRICKTLQSESQENVEYDRALVEFLWDAFDVSRETAAASLNIPLWYVYPVHPVYGTTWRPPYNTERRTL